MTNLDSILKSRDITSLSKVCLVKAMVFPVVMYGCKTIKKVEHWRIDAFELWCWRRLLRVPWIAKRSNQSILKGNQPWIFFGRTDSEAEAPILWPPDVKSIGGDPNAGNDWGQKDMRVAEGEMVEWHRWLDGYEFEQTLGIGKDREAWHAVVHGVANSHLRHHLATDNHH